MTNIEKALVYYDGNGDMPYCDIVYKALKEMQSRCYCKECKSYDRDFEQCFRDYYPGNFIPYRKPDDFCSCGRRKEGDSDV